MIGNEAVGLGALVAGCRVMSAYPITPASEIMEWLQREFPKLGGVVVQVRTRSRHHDGHRRRLGGRPGR